ncbi:MAG: hypothetical protein IMZ41_01860 [Actinobacteria bacterium]|nr:hypothetical protein [Actinomycetota bacterium]
MKLIKSDITKKMMAIIAFTCIIISLIIIIITPPANIYEISIYNVYPWYFWFLITAAIFIGQLIIFIDVFYDSPENKNKVWLLGATTIIIPIIIVLTLPVIRGYPTYGFGDHLTHIGIIKDIIQFGNIPQDNFYPNLHILTASLLLVSNWGILDSANFIPIFFFILSPISIYLFFRIIFNKRNEMKLALIFTSTFLFFEGNSIYLAPYYQSFLLMPIILYLYFRRGTTKDTILFSLLFIIMLVSYTFYHPINLLLLTLVFLFFAVTFYLYPKINIIKLTESPEKRLKETSLNVIFFASLLFFIWYFSFSTIIKYFNKVFVSTFSGIYESPFQSEVNSLSTYSPSLFDIIKITFYTYGLLAIVGLSVIFSLVYIFIKWKRNKQTFQLRFFTLSSMVSLIFFFGLIACSIFTDLIVGWDRFMLWATMFSIILITFSFYSLLSDSKQHNLLTIPFKKIGRTITVIIIIVSLTSLSILTVYPSPITGNTNLQVTKTDWMGTEWIFENSNKKTIIDQLGISQSRFLTAIYGEKEYKLIIIKRLGYTNPPDHFSYNNKTSLGEYYNESRYMIINHLARIRYPESYPDYKELWRFTPHDFDQLQNDNTVIRLYDNGGFESYLVKLSKI